MASSPTIPGGASAAVLPGTSSKSSGIQFWPNPIPLEFGIIRTPENKHQKQATKYGGQRFPANQLRKLLVYLRAKGKSVYPNFRFGNWLQIATSKLSMTEQVAWLYFETFDMVCDISARDRLDLLKMTVESSSPEGLRKRLSVNTIQFVLFLYLQNMPRYSLKTPMVAGEEWPSPESESRQKSPEDYHTMFVRANLQEMLELLQDPEQVLSEEAVNGLGFVLCASKNCKEYSLLELAIAASSKSGHSKVSRTFSLTQFEYWIRSLLTVNPFGPRALMSHRKQLKPVSCFKTEGNGRLLTNHTAIPKFRSSLLHRISKQTLSISDTSLHHSMVYIRNCQRSNIYLLAPLKSVFIEKCSRCVLVLGAVSSGVVVNNSDSLTIVTACRRLHVSSSSMCIFHLLTMTHPVLFPASLHITFAPYNTHYPSLDQHISLSGLSPALNYWDSPIDLTGGSSEPSIWELMPPKLFRPMEVPFDLPGETDEIPCPIPPPYLKMLAVRKERIQQWHDLVGRTRLTKEQSEQLRSVVVDHFEEWLGSEGHKKDLQDLGMKSLPLVAAKMDGLLVSARHGQGKHSHGKPLQ